MVFTDSDLLRGIPPNTALESAPFWRPTQVVGWLVNVLSQLDVERRMCVAGGNGGFM
jgi:hypothetical protein